MAESRLDAGIVMRNERDLPAYVRAILEVGRGRGSKGLSVASGSNTSFCFPLSRDGVEGIVGSEGVRSMTGARGKLISNEDSVTDLASMRLASFLGVPTGDCDGVTDSNTPERSRATLADLTCEEGDGVDDFCRCFDAER